MKILLCWRWMVNDEGRLWRVIALVANMEGNTIPMYQSCDEVSTSPQNKRKIISRVLFANEAKFCTNLHYPKTAMVLSRRNTPICLLIGGI